LDGSAHLPEETTSISFTGLRGNMASQTVTVERRRASFRDEIRLATRAAHERVDRLYSVFDLADPQDYRRFLIAHHDVFPQCEAILDTSGARRLVPDWTQRMRAADLATDLTLLGIDPAPVLPASPVGEAAMFGMMYVLEGSRLGGAVLARRVLANPDPDCRAATRYLRHGEGLKLWPSFVAAFTASPIVDDHRDAVIASALRTFDMFCHAAENPDSRASLKAGL